MPSQRLQAASGVSQLDHLLGGLFIGDNVIWYDDAGSLAAVFCLKFLQVSQAQGKPLIYVSFDRSPKNLLEKLGPLARNQHLIILDCFTHGKGAGSEVFLRFYANKPPRRQCRIICVKTPEDSKSLSDTLYTLHAGLSGDVRFIFESLTGMQELWEGEEHILNFYAHSCPRLYELNTIAYWMIEKRAHSPRMRARINQIAQVAIDLTLKRGKTLLTILKAENRDLRSLNKPFEYWSNQRTLGFEFEMPGRPARPFDLGRRIKALRSKRGLSQTELAKLVGVTASNISQIESNAIYPSLPALIKMAEVLAVQIGSFFQASAHVQERVVFKAEDATAIQFAGLSKEVLSGRLLTPLDAELNAEPYLIEIAASQKLPAHFFIHKGHEMGYVLQGKLELKIGEDTHQLAPGDMVCLTSQMPTQWQTMGSEPTRMLWFKLR